MTEQLFLFVGQVRRNLDGIGHNQVTELSFLLINRESFTFQSDFRTVLRFRFYLQFHFTVQRIDHFLTSQYSRVKVYFHIYVQVVAQAFEHRVFGYHERNVQVARRSSVDTFGSVALQFDYLSIGYTGTDMGGAFFLPKIVGYARACEILMNPNRFGAEKLLEWGFANKVVADDDVVEEAVAFAQQMCDATAPFGLRLTKECLQASLDGTSFENVVKMENRNQVLASNTNDGQMGVGKMNPKNKQDVKDNPEKYQFHNL